MRNLVRKCRGIGGVSVAKVSPTTTTTTTTSTSDRDHQVVGVMTRARRALAMAAASAEIEKRRKVDHDSGDQLQFTSSYVQIRTRRRVVITANKAVSPSPPAENSSGGDDRLVLPCERINCSSPSSDAAAADDDDDRVLASRCSSNGSSELLHDKSLRSGSDLESGGFEFDSYSACILGCSRERRETTPISGALEAKSNDLEQTKRPSEANSRRRSTAEMMPSEAELDEFFTAAENAEKKRFREKYNFDVVKDVSLKGRYEWVRLKP